MDLCVEPEFARVRQCLRALVAAGELDD